MWMCADSGGAFPPLLRSSSGLWPPITAHPSTFKLINLTSNEGLIRLRLKSGGIHSETRPSGKRPTGGVCFFAACVTYIQNELF